jgi:hypothetical protein
MLSIARINQTQHILDGPGPSAFYWMTEIAAQHSNPSAAQVNCTPTNVNVELGESVTAEHIVVNVIKN